MINMLIQILVLTGLLVVEAVIAAQYHSEEVLGA